MKFIMATSVYVILGALICVGILHLLQGKPWLLIGTVVAYVVSLARLGCLPKHTH